MNRSLFLKTTLSLVTLSLLSLLCTNTTLAQCGGAFKKTSAAPRAAMLRGGLLPVAYPQNDLDKWGDERDENGLEPIVGLWKVVFTDADKNYTDTAYVTWHSDFTEFQNSERAPSTGAVCQGVWKKVGRSTYRLNHYALAYGDNVNLTNVIRIREEVTVDPSHKNFAGVFITDIYDTSHNLLVEFKGPITGKRVTVNSDIDSQ